MNYEEKYKKALETVQEILNSGSDSIKMSRLRLRLQSVFTELIESEDERIKGAIIEHLRDNYLTEWASWLEKQGQKDPCEDCKHPMLDCHNFTCSKKQKYQGKSALEAIKEEKVDNSNRVEPKFKENDWITNGEDTIQITIVDTKSGHSGYYRCFEGSHGFGWYVIDIESTNKNYHLWSLQDAKNGDILAFDNDTIVIFKGLYNATTFHSYCYIEDGAFNISEDETPDWWEGKNFHPATKEQRDILFQKAKEAGYEWDAEKKKLREIKQKSSWSEEDDVKLNDTINLIEQSGNVRNIREHYISWLQSLKQRATWKPSNEQIKALRWVLNNVPCNKHKEEISGLLDQIKDL